MTSDVSRRRVLEALAVMAPLALAAPGLLGSRRAEAQAKATQQQVKYQDTPNKGQQCSTCLHFIAPDQCKLVAGKINPKGWCLLFAPKPK